MSVRKSRPGPLPAIDRYQARELLGEGAFGTVYRAFDPRLERDVALKVLRPEWTTSPQAVERFLREAKAAAKLTHAHIVPVHDAGRDGDVYYIASAFIRGKTLAAAVPKGGMEPRRAAELVARLASALGYAHQQGVVHRDVKPQNILLDERGSPHLTDFGLAAWLQEERTRLTQDGVVMGTPLYMSPEQASGDAMHVGPASDLYSAGLVLYVLLTGRLPFEASHSAALAYRIVHTAPPPPSQFRPGLDVGLETFCLTALAKRPEERFGSGEEMAAALAGWAAAAPAPTRATAPPPDAPLPWERETVDHRPDRPGAATQSAAPASPGIGRGGRSGLRWVLGGCGLVLAAALAWVGVAYFFHPPSAPSPVDKPAGPKEPARAVAPFDAGEAKRLQQTWAEYLGAPVEREVDLGGAVTMKLRLIPPGSFSMGSPDSAKVDVANEKPRHKVTITKPFYLGAAPVTQEEYVRVTGLKNPSAFSRGGVNEKDVQDRDTARFPVEQVTWDEAKACCEALNGLDGKRPAGWNYALPTEARWEYACRAGTTTAYFFADDATDLADYAWYGWNAHAQGRAHEVGTRKPNPWGLYDMHGNVWQWCADRFGPYG